MKRLIQIFLLFLMVLTMTSCKKNKLEGSFDKVDFHISGIYIEMEKDQNYRVDRLNPSIYYDHTSKKVETNRGGFNLEYSNIMNQTTEEDGVIIVKIFVNILFPRQTSEKINIYVVKENSNGNHYVDQSMSDILDTTKTGNYRINYKYINNNQKYRFQFEIKYSRKEA